MNKDTFLCKTLCYQTFIFDFTMNLLNDTIFNITKNINLSTFWNSAIIISAEIFLILLSIFISSIFIYMITLSGLLHIHFIRLIQFAYSCFLFSNFTRLAIIIGILLNLPNSGYFPSFYGF